MKKLYTLAYPTDNDLNAYNDYDKLAYVKDFEKKEVTYWLYGPKIRQQLSQAQFDACLKNALLALAQEETKEALMTFESYGGPNNKVWEADIIKGVA